MFLPLPAAVFIPVKPCFVIGLSATLICAFKATSKTDGKNVICLPIKQLGVLQSSFKCVICSRSNWKCCKRENQSSWRKTCQSKKVNPQQTQITMSYGVDGRIWTWGHIARRWVLIPLSHLCHSSASQHYYNMMARIEPWTYRSEVQGVSYHLTTMTLLVKVPSIVSIVNIGLRCDLSENLLTNESKKLNCDKLSWPTQVLSKITKVDSLKRKEIYIFSTLPPPISPALEPGRAVPGTYLMSVKVYRLSAVRLKIKHDGLLLVAKKGGNWTYLYTS